MSETTNLAADYLDEDPSTLTEEQLQEVSRLFNLPIEKVRVLVKDMEKARANIDPSEITPQ